MDHLSCLTCAPVELGPCITRIDDDVTGFFIQASDELVSGYVHRRGIEAYVDGVALYAIAIVNGHGVSAGGSNFQCPGRFPSVPLVRGSQILRIQDYELAIAKDRIVAQFGIGTRTTSALNVRTQPFGLVTITE